MSKRNVDSMHKKLQTLQKQMIELGPIMRGSVVLIGTKSKQYYFSLNKDKKTKLIYLGEKRVDLARQYSENYKKLLSIVEEMTILNMEMLRQSRG